MADIANWLSNALAEHDGLDMEAEEVSEYSMLAGVLRAQAEAEGFRADDLERACGGDIPAYLFSHDVLGLGRESSW